MNNKEIKRKNMINIIYEAKEEVIDEIIKKTDEELKDKLKISEIDIEEIIKDSRNSKELKEIFNKIEDNYNIKITEYNKKIYKQGFIDGVHLILDCLNMN